MSSSAVPLETTYLVRDHCLCLHTQRAARALARHFDEAFRPLGLSSGQFSLLMALNRPEPPAIGQVAALLGLDRTTLTAAVKPLERRGLIEVTPGARDRRSRVLRLTPGGSALLARAVPIWTKAHAEAESLLPADTADSLRGALDALAQAAPRAGSPSLPS